MSATNPSDATTTNQTGKESELFTAAVKTTTRRNQLVKDIAQVDSELQELDEKKDALMKRRVALKEEKKKIMEEARVAHEHLGKLLANTSVV